MAYPERSNFRTAGNDAWWDVVSPDGSRRRCQMSGSLFVRQIQDMVRRRVPANSPTYAGTISGSSVTVDGKIGPNTAKGLYALLSIMGAPENLKAAVASDAAEDRRLGNSAVTPGVINASIWLIINEAIRAGGSTPVQPGTMGYVPEDVITPLWNTAPAVGNIQTTCQMVNGPTVPTTDLPDGGGGGGGGGGGWSDPSPGPKPGDAGNKSIATTEEIVEGLSKVGEPGTKDGVTLALERPVSDLPSTPPNTGLSTGTMVAIGVGAVAVIALIAVVAMRSGGSSGGTKRRRRNPSKRRAR